VNNAIPAVAPYIAPRTAEFGAVPGLAEACPPERTLDVYRRMRLIRHFDLRVRDENAAGAVECLVYLSVGQEAVAAAVAAALPGAWSLAQHRGHSVYLAFGGNPVALVDELLGLPSGCCGGLGGSPPINDIKARVIGHNGLVGDQVPVAAGIALCSGGAPVACFFGDGAAEEDYVLATLGFAASRKLPLLFVCEDNDLSVLTPIAERRSWEVVDVARGFGMEAVDIADDPWLIGHWVDQLKHRLPALINIRTCRSLWHVGTGQDGPPEWDRMALVHETISRLGLAQQAERIDQETKQFVEDLWQERLRKRSAS
jgi:pyruvate dehydrogenase E1 component alpha subunit